MTERELKYDDILTILEILASVGGNMLHKVDWNDLEDHGIAMSKIFVSWYGFTEVYNDNFYRLYKAMGEPELSIRSD